MNVNLPPELAQLVQLKVQSGRNNSATEVVHEALRLLERNDESRSVQLQELRNRMDHGLAPAERGEGADGETFMQDLIQELDNRHASRKAG